MNKAKARKCRESTLRHRLLSAQITLQADPSNIDAQLLIEEASDNIKELEAWQA